MSNQIGWVAALLLSPLAVSAADVIHLKENAAIIGQMISQKRDQIVIDVGYTALVIPRDQIVSISQSDIPLSKDSTSTAPSALVIAPPNALTNPPVAGFYQSSSQIGEDRPVRELVHQLGEGVVQVRTPSGLGSGFVINEEGHLITNFHVIENETQISVEVYHQRKDDIERKVYKDVRIVAMNKFADLALLRIEEKNPPKFVSVALGDMDNLAVGQRVFAIGSPLGLERTVTEGILSTKTRQIQGSLYIQTTAQINPGNSGGPLFNMRGEVVGVTSMKLTFGEGLGFAIPIDTVRHFLKNRDAYAYDTDNPSNPYRYLEPPSRILKVSAEDKQ